MGETLSYGPRLQLIGAQNGRIDDIDGVRIEVGDRVLVDYYGSLHDSENGIYELIREGSDDQFWILERTEDALNIVSGMMVYVEEGTKHSGESYVVSNNHDIIMNVSPIDFALFSKPTSDFESDPGSESESDYESDYTGLMPRRIQRSESSDRFMQDIADNAYDTDDTDEEFEREYNSKSCWNRLRRHFKALMEADIDEIVTC